MTSFDAELRELVTDLLDTVTGEPGRAGVAATADRGRARGCSATPSASGRVRRQPGAHRRVGGDQDDEEGCLSIPGLYFPRRRAAGATVDGFDQHGEPITVSGTGLLARALQHETDHLNGKLYIDGLTGDVRRQALRAVRSAPWAAR